MIIVRSKKLLAATDTHTALPFWDFFPKKKNDINMKRKNIKYAFV